MGEWRCTFDYSIFIVYLSYVVGKKGAGSKEQGAGSRVLRLDS